MLTARGGIWGSRLGDQPIRSFWPSQDKTKLKILQGKHLVQVPVFCFVFVFASLNREKLCFSLSLVFKNRYADAVSSAFCEEIVRTREQDNEK